MAPRIGTTGCWPTSTAKAEMRPGGIGWPAAVRPIASTTVTILSSNSLAAGLAEGGEDHAEDRQQRPRRARR